MEIKRSSLVYRWAFLLDPARPHKVSLCYLFWSVVLFTPLKLCFIIGVAFGILFGSLIFPVMKLGWAGLLIAPTIILLVYIGVKINRHMANRDLDGPREPGLVRSYLKAKKDRFCPIITVKGV